jgi:hypothetical protein
LNAVNIAWERAKTCLRTGKPKGTCEQEGRIVGGDLFQWLSTIPWFGWVAVTAIVCGSLSSIFQQYFRHAERIEMIRQGMNPDAVVVESDEEKEFRHNERMEMIRQGMNPGPIVTGTGGETNKKKNECSEI